MGDYSVTLNSDSDIIVGVHEGSWTVEDSYPFVDEILKMVENTGVRKVIIDHRALQLDAGTLDLFFRAEDVAAVNTPLLSLRVAMVYSTERTQNEERYRFFETVLRNRGLNLRVFPGVLDEAVAWLRTD